MTVPDRTKNERLRAARDGARAGAGNAYEALAETEARRADAVATALAAAEVHRLAVADADRAEGVLADAVAHLVALGMALPDIAATLDVDVRMVRRLYDRNRPLA